MSQRRAVATMSRRPVGLMSALLALAAVVGLIMFTFIYPPAGTTLPVFFAILFLAAAGLACPLLLLWDARSRQPAPRRRVWVALRRSLWVGLWVALCAWLQLVRLLDVTTALLFLVVLALGEWLLSSRRR
jgi:hypothetical protein